MSNINIINNNLEPVGCYSDKLKENLHKIDHKNRNFSMNDCINHANDNKYLCNNGESGCQYFSYNKSTRECLVGGKILDDIEFEKYNSNNPCNQPIYITPELTTLFLFKLLAVAGSTTINHIDRPSASLKGTSGAR